MRSSLLVIFFDTLTVVEKGTSTRYRPGMAKSQESRGPFVEIGWSADETHVTLHVTDNGPGLANPSNLFVPFYTTKPEGAGIGLTLSRQIAAAHQGSVSLRNRTDGHGCIAEVLLPLAPMPEAS